MTPDVCVYCALLLILQDFFSHINISQYQIKKRITQMITFTNFALSH